jgi:hypothetical protein
MIADLKRGALRDNLQSLPGGAEKEPNERIKGKGILRNI